MATSPVTDASFENDVLGAPEPVVVDFWAEWCGPCKMIGPHLEELSEELAGKVKIVKLNVDENQQTAIKYGIRSIPTMMIFKGWLVARVFMHLKQDKPGLQQSFFAGVLLATAVYIVTLLAFNVFG